MERSGDMLQNLFEFAIDAIAVIDPHNGRFLDCNAKALENLGYDRDEFLTRTVADLHDDMTPGDIRKIFRKQMLGRSMRIETIHKRKDGSYMPVEVTSTLIRLGDRQVLQAFIRDITQRKKAEAEKEALICKLEKALDEIRTLRGILPICSFCKRVRDDKGYWEQVDTYIKDHTEATISHGLCPRCAREHYGDFYTPDDSDTPGGDEPPSGGE